MRERPLAECRLCQSEALLCDSHLFPAAMFRLLSKPGAKNPNPVSFGEGRRGFSSSRQIKDYLLCESCEHRFHSNGEEWVMKNCYRGQGHFALRDAVLQHRATVIMKEGSVGFRSADMPEIDMSKLIYFGMSVFWRAGAHTWKIHDRTVSLELGPYLEPIRAYLLGGSFPEEHVELYVRISTLHEDCKRLSEPASIGRNGYRNHNFYMAGLAFTLALGKNIPRYFRHLSTAPGGLIAINRQLDQKDLEYLATVKGLTIVKPIFL
jgi:hypothetical protein